MAKQAKCITSLQGELECDTIECNPNIEYQRVFACGYYHLDESRQQRIGKLSIFELTSDHSLQELCFIEDRFGVLDCCWDQQGSFIFTAEADGTIGAYKFSNKDKLELVSEHQRPGVISLAVDQQKDNQNVIASFSDGYITLFSFSEGEILPISELHAHKNSEVWTTCFSKHSPFVFTSGGDDCRLNLWDSRALSDLTPVKSKRYDMGVTSMQWHYSNENLVYVGSYDESVSLWDIRQFKQPVSSISIGGGVWRIKAKPAQPDYILSATMYNQFHLLHCDPSTQEFSVVTESFGKPIHADNSLAYGVDWFVDTQSSSNPFEIACCSFYDKTCSCWTLTD